MNRTILDRRLWCFLFFSFTVNVKLFSRLGLFKLHSGQNLIYSQVFFCFVNIFNLKFLTFFSLYGTLLQFSLNFTIRQLRLVYQTLFSLRSIMPKLLPNNYNCAHTYFFDKHFKSYVVGGINFPTLVPVKFIHHSSCNNKKR